MSFADRQLDLAGNNIIIDHYSYRLDNTASPYTITSQIVADLA